MGGDGKHSDAQAISVFRDADREAGPRVEDGDEVGDDG